MGQTSISPFCAPLGKLWVRFTNRCTRTLTKRERELRDSLTQKLYFKTHLDGSMAVPHAPALPSWKLREWFTFTLSQWPDVSGVGSAERGEVEEAVASHPEMAFLCCSALTLSFFPVLSTSHLPHHHHHHLLILLRSSLSLRWQPWQRRWTPSWKHFLSEGIAPSTPPSHSLSTGFPLPTQDWHLSPPFLSLLCLCLLFTSIYTVYLWMSCQILHLDPYSQSSCLRVRVLISVLCGLAIRDRLRTSGRLIWSDVGP